MHGVWQDVRYAWRTLVKNPGFTIVVVLAMGLGIGVNASIYTIVRGVLLREPPFPAPDRLVSVETTSRKTGESEPFGCSYPDYLDFHDRARTLESLGAYTETTTYLTLGSEPERFNATFVTASLLPTLGIRPERGRLFLPEEAELGKQYTTMLLSHRVWKDRLNSDPGVIGRTFNVNGRQRTVIGVMPDHFNFPEIADFWLPMAYAANEDTRGAHYLDTVGRLKPGVTLAQANTEVAGIARQLAKDHPKTNDGIGAVATDLHVKLVRHVRTSMIMLLFAVMFVLLIACANVANLMLARASTRQREISVRVALGASRGRIARQLLTESVLVSLLGGVLGVFIAYWSNDLVLGSIPIELPYWMTFTIDGGVLAFTVAISVTAGLLAGLAPVVQGTRRNLFESLKEGGLQGGIGGGHHRLRNGLVVAEIALAMVLLVGSGLMIRSFLRLQEVHGAFDPQGVLTGSVTLPVAVYPRPADRIRFFEELLPRLRALPGVVDASAAAYVPLMRSMSTTGITREGHEDDGPSRFPLTNFSFVMPDYFKTLRIRVRAGREFTAADGPTAQRVAVVNQSAAKLLWPGEDPLGKRFEFGADDTAGWCTVIGVVDDVRAHATNPRVAQVFVPHAQSPGQTMNLLLRSSGDPAALAPFVRNILRARDPNLPFYDVRTLPEGIRQAMWEQRLYAWLMGAYSLIALVIAALGIYGVMAYRVAQRTQEIGIRMALGAPQSAVLRMVVGQGLRLTLLGLGLGLAGAFVVTRFMASLLFGVDPNDPPTFTGVALILGASALLASWLPAWRASRVDPMTALRHE